MSNFQKILEWHNAFGVPILPVPTNPVYNRLRLRKTLILEEARELFEAMDAGDLIEVADGIGDLLVVTYGTAAEYGIDADAVYAEVHRSNMSKLGRDGKPILREDGKILKGPDFFKPDLRRVLHTQEKLA